MRSKTRAVSVHGGLRVQHGCQFPWLCGRFCACTRCLETVGLQSSEGCEKCEVNTRGNDVAAACLTPVSVWRDLLKSTR